MPSVLRAISSAASTLVQIDGLDARAMGWVGITAALVRRSILIDQSIDRPTAGGINATMWPSNWTTGASKN